MSDLVSEKTIAAVEEMEARQVGEADMRIQVIREICRKEGHGRLVDMSTHEDLPHTVIWCQRGCGVVMYQPAAGVSLVGFLDYLRLRNVTGTARFTDRGLIVVEVDA